MTAAALNSLTVSWTAPSSGAVTSYTVTLKEGTITKVTKPGVTETTATFDSLTAGTKYTVEVVSVAGVLTSGGQSSDSLLSGNFYTSKSVWY